MDPEILESIRKGSIKNRLRHVETAAAKPEAQADPRGNMLAAIRRASVRANLRHVSKSPMHQDNTKNILEDDTTDSKQTAKSDSDASWGAASSDDDDMMDSQDMASRMSAFKALVSELSSQTSFTQPPPKRTDIPSSKFLDHSLSSSSMRSGSIDVAVAPVIADPIPEEPDSPPSSNPTAPEPATTQTTPAPAPPAPPAPPSPAPPTPEPTTHAEEAHSGNNNNASAGHHDDNDLDDFGDIPVAVATLHPLSPTAKHKSVTDSPPVLGKKISSGIIPRTAPPPPTSAPPPQVQKKTSSRTPLRTTTPTKPLVQRTTSGARPLVQLATSSSKPLVEQANTPPKSLGQPVPATGIGLKRGSRGSIDSESSSGRPAVPPIAANRTQTTPPLRPQGTMKAKRRKMPKFVEDITPGWMADHIGERYQKLMVQQISKLTPTQTFLVGGGDTSTQTELTNAPFFILKTPGMPVDSAGDAWTGTRECYFYERLAEVITESSFIEGRASPLDLAPVLFTDTEKLTAVPAQQAASGEGDAQKKDILVACTCLVDVVKRHLPGIATRQNADCGEVVWTSMHAHGLSGVGIKTVVAAVAHFHARYWNRDMVTELKNLPEGGMWGAPGWYQRVLPDFLTEMKSILSPFTLYLAESLGIDFAFMLDSRHLKMAPQTLCHNNLSPDCIWLNGGDDSTKALITDWECVACSTPALDLAMLLSSTLSVNARHTQYTTVLKHYIRGLARNGVAASQRSEAQITELINLGVVLLLPKLVSLFDALRASEARMKEQTGSLSQMNAAVLELKKKQLRAWVGRAVAMIDELEDRALITLTLVEMYQKFKAGQTTFFRKALGPSVQGFDLYHKPAEIGSIRSTSWQTAQYLWLDTSGRAHDSIGVQLGGSGVNDDGAVLVKFSHFASRELIANRLGRMILPAQTRCRVLPRLSEEWGHCLTHLHRIAHMQQHTLFGPSAVARVDAFRTLPLLLVSEFVQGGPEASLDVFSGKTGEANGVFWQGVDNAARTPRGTREQESLTRTGWKLIFDFGVYVAFALFVNDEASIPVAHVWDSGHPKHFLIHPQNHNLIVTNHSFFTPVDPNNTPTHTNHIRSVKRFLIDAFVAHMLAAPFASPILRARLMQAWVPTLTFLEDHLNLQGALQTNYHVLEMLSAGLKEGMSHVCKIDDSTLRTIFGSTKADIMPALSKNNTSMLGSFPLKMLRSATALDESDVKYLIAMRNLFDAFLHPNENLKREVATFQDTHEQAVDHVVLPRETRFGLPQSVAKWLCDPRPMQKMISKEKHHDRLIQLSSKGQKLIWLKPDDSGGEPKKKGFAPIGDVMSLFVSLDKEARQVLEIQWGGGAAGEQHAILLRESSADDGQSFAFWVASLPHLIKFNSGRRVDVNFSADFLECIAEPSIFLSRFGLTADAKRRVQRLRLPMTIGELAGALA